MTLPTVKQLSEAGVWMTNASHYCHAAFLFADQPECKILSEKAVEDLKCAAEALGFELVQRVTPAARGGGRMDVEVEDA